MIYLASTFLIFFLFFISIDILIRKSRKAQVLMKDESYNLLLFFNPPTKPIPFQELKFRFYKKDAKLANEINIQLNNMGLFSTYNYSLDEDAFRILIIGGENTASHLALKCWPDFLQDNLQKAYPNKKIRVYNVGWPGASLANYFDIWENYGKQFKPHLVIVNLMEADYFKASPSELYFKGKQFHGRHSNVEFKLKGGKKALLPVLYQGLIPRKRIALNNNNVVVNGTWSIAVDENLLNDSSAVADLQTQLVNQYVSTRAPWGYYAWLWMRGKKNLLSVFNGRSLSVLSVEESDDEKCTNGLTHLQKLKDNISNLMLIHNFNYPEYMENLPFRISNMIEYQLGIEITDMRKYLSKYEYSEMRKLFMSVPISEKWSALGHQVYADLVTQCLKEKGKL